MHHDGRKWMDFTSLAGLNAIEADTETESMWDLEQKSSFLFDEILPSKT